MSVTSPVRIIGIGSPHGDDAIGWEVVRQVQRNRPLKTVEYYMIAGGHELLHVLDGRGTAIIVDAASPDGQPGRLVHIQWPGTVPALLPGTTHDFGIATALQMAEALGVLPPNVMIYALEADNDFLHQDFSPAIRAAIPRLVTRLLRKLDGLPAEHTTETGRSPCSNAS